jgi:hypothetical protein
MLGYVQLAPRGEPISPELFAQLLNSQFGSLGGPVDCMINIAQSGQLMRLSRVDVNASESAGGMGIFVSAARGSVVSPRTAPGASPKQPRDRRSLTPRRASHCATHPAR